jgi:hypothetical protein
VTRTAPRSPRRSRRALRRFNPLGILGWVVSARLLRRPTIDVGSARLFNRLVPLARRLDFLSRIAGLALLACAERP